MKVVFEISMSLSEGPSGIWRMPHLVKWKHTGSKLEAKMEAMKEAKMEAKMEARMEARMHASTE
jgi:hypothetical protein